MNENNLNENVINNENNVSKIIVPEGSPKEKNKKRKAKFLICGVLVIIAIAVGLYVGYKKLNNDPMGIYKDSINGLYKILNNAINESKDKNLDSIDISKEPFVFELNGKLESDMPELKNFTGLNYHIATGMDLANKKINVGLDIKDNKDSLVNLILSVIDKNIYLKIFDKVLDLGEEDIFGNIDLNTSFSVNGNSAKFDYDNYSYILKEFKTIIIDSLDKNKFAMEEETITINGKEYKAKKAIYNLDKENMERTLKFIKERILKDDKLITAISESIGITETELKDALNEEIDMNGYNDIKINLYTDKLNNLIAGSTTINNSEIRFDCVNDEVNFEIKDDSNSLKVVKEKNDNIVISYNENSSQLFKITFEGNDKNFKIPFLFNIEGSTISGTIELKNIETSKDSASADIIFSLNTMIENQKIDFTIDGNYRVAKTNIETLDTTNSIKIDDITEEEAMEIFEKLGTLLERFGLSDFIGSTI